MKWLGLVRANLGRNKLRTALTGAAISLAVALVCMLLTMPAGLNSLLDNLTTVHADDPVGMLQEVQLVCHQHSCLGCKCVLDALLEDVAANMRIHCTQRVILSTTQPTSTPWMRWDGMGDEMRKETRTERRTKQAVEFHFILFSSLVS